MIKKTLQGANLKQTKARIAVLSALEESKVPMDASEIHKQIQKSNSDVDLATIYRILEKFEASGIAHRVNLNKDRFHYELLSLPHHHHVVCKVCGKVQDIQDCDLSTVEQSVKENLGFAIQNHRLEFFGFCKNCS